MEEHERRGLCANVILLANEMFSEEQRANPVESQLVRVIEQFLTLLNARRTKSLLGHRVFIDYTILLALHGIPYSYLEKENFEKLSEMEASLRAQIFLYKRIYMQSAGWLSEEPEQFNDYTMMKQDEMAYSLNSIMISAPQQAYHSLALCLQNREQLRKANKKLRTSYKHFCAAYHPTLIRVITHLNLRATMTESFDVEWKLIEIAELAISNLYTIFVVNPIMGLLTELVWVCVAKGWWKTAGAIFSLERLVHRRNRRHLEYMNLWKALRLLVLMESAMSIESSATMSSRSLDVNDLEELISDFGERGLMFVEVIIQFWFKAEDEDKAVEVITRWARSFPQFAYRLIVMLPRIGFPHEIETVVDAACDDIDSTLHPSNDVWLHWCRPRIAEPEKYTTPDILPRCVTALFKFLDYGSNRAKGEAWVALWAAVQRVDKNCVAVHWEERKDWWPRFHVVPLDDRAAACRAEIIAALCTEL